MGLLDRVKERGNEKRALRADNARLAHEATIMRANGELLVEHVDDLELRLAEDEAGWRRVTTDEGEWSHDRRRRTIALARIMAAKNPLIRKQVRTQMAYVFGRGVDVKAHHPEANAVLRDFLDDARNRDVITSPLALADRERDLQTDGELFVTLWVARDDFAVTARLLPPTEVEHVYANPEDKFEPWYYLRHYRQAGGEDQYRAYIDHRYARALEAEGKRVSATVDYQHHTWTVAVDDAGEPVPTLHVRVGAVGDMRRGLPEVLAMLDWATAYKLWLEDWGSIARSLARFAWRMSTTGNAAATASAMGSRLGTGLGETNPAPVAGSVFVSNPGHSLEPIRTSGVNPNADDGLQLRKMTAAGSSFPDTILSGDPQQGALATARTLDRPTELTIMMRQELWRDVLRTIARFVIAAAIDSDELEGTVDTSRGNLRIDLPTENPDDDDPSAVDVDFPPVLEQDPGALVDAAVKAATLDGKVPVGTIPPRTLAAYMLTALGIDDQDEILAALFPDEADPMGLGQIAPPAEGGDDQDEEAAAEAELVRAARELREALTEGARSDA